MEASVIIPFYNAETTLSRAIESVIAQQNVSLQILLIDNNSTDSSREIAQSYVDKHKHITIHTENNKGANYARNLGLSLAEKEWIQYLDADDELLPLKIHHQLSLKNLSEIDVISSPIIEYTINGEVIHYSVSGGDDLWTSLIQGKIGWTCSNLWKKSTLLNIGGWKSDQSSQQETELMFRLIAAEKYFLYFNVAECIVYEQNNSISKKSNFPLTGIKLMQRIEQHLLTKNILDTTREKAIQNKYYNYLLWAHKTEPIHAQKIQSEIRLKYGLIDRPWYHKISNVIGINNTFLLLSKIHRITYTSSSL